MPRRWRSETRLLLQLPDFDIPKGDFAAVFLQEDVAAGPLGEFGHVPEFAVRKGILEFRRRAVAIQNLLAVQPMFEVIAAHDDFRRVPFADRAGLLRSGGRDQIIKRSNGSIAVAPKLRIGMPGIVQNLIFISNGRAGGSLRARAGDGLSLIHISEPTRPY